MTFFWSRAQLLGAISLACALAATATAADLAGPAQIVDADSLLIAGREIRLAGLDAPEWDQTCTSAAGAKWRAGQEAKAWLASRLAGRDLACTAEGRDAYRRILATCYLDGDNLNHAMVAAGWAWAYVKYSKRYAAAEAEARAAGAGVWRGRCDPPWEWRQQQRGK